MNFNINLIVYFLFCFTIFFRPTCCDATGEEQSGVEKESGQAFVVEVRIVGADEAIKALPNSLNRLALSLEKIVEHGKLSSEESENLNQALASIGRAVEKVTNLLDTSINPLEKVLQISETGILKITKRIQGEFLTPSLAEIKATFYKIAMILGGIVFILLGVNYWMLRRLYLGFAKATGDN
jgi:putative Mn2+ efflux pump MntP